MPLLIVGVFLLIAASVTVGIQIEKRRRAALAAVAAELGYGFSHERSPVDLPFGLLRQGSNRYGHSFFDRVDALAIAGLADVRLTLFEYHYETSSGFGDDETTHDHWFACAAVEPGLDLGEVRVRTEHFGDRLAAAAGFEDIDFEDPEFSRRWHVSAKHRRDAYALLEHEMMDVLTDKTSWTFETCGPFVLIHRSGRLSPERVRELDRVVHQFLGAIPRTLVNDERGRRGLAPLLAAGAPSR